jgi:ribulose-phosphate 3-epimerase
VIEAVRRTTRLPLDVHLMISEPGRYLERFRKAGADLMTIHVEAVDDPRPLLREIRRLGAVAGLTLNPPTPIEAVKPYLDDCDLVLVMSVAAGFGGQEFEPQAVDRLRRLRTAGGNDLLLSVDGGINDQTIGPCAEAGADVFVTGSALFAHHDYRQVMEEFRCLALAHKDIQV